MAKEPSRMHHWSRSHHQPRRHFRCLVWRLKIGSELPARAIISRDIAPHVEHKRERMSASSLHQNIRTSVRLLPLSRPFTSNHLSSKPSPRELKPINYSCVHSSHECLYLSSPVDTTSVTSLHPPLPTAIHVSASDPGYTGPQ